MTKVILPGWQAGPAPSRSGGLGMIPSSQQYSVTVQAVLTRKAVPPGAAAGPLHLQVRSMLDEQDTLHPNVGWLSCIKYYQYDTKQGGNACTMRGPPV